MKASIQSTKASLGRFSSLCNSLEPKALSTQSAGFLSSRPNRVSQPPHRKRKLPPPLWVQGGDTLACEGRGWGDPIPTIGQTLWYSRYTIIPLRPKVPIPPTSIPETSAGIFKQSMGTKSRVGIGLSYRPARLHCLAELVPWNRFLGSS